MAEEKLFYLLAKMCFELLVLLNMTFMHTLMSEITCILYLQET